ncbi:MAG: hypothetical protein HC933_06345 [Pleurocapsa sp. SU_196_0]|nr:hypothetical protein [Pleurocapsa sp. SU_196_0]
MADPWSILDGFGGERVIALRPSLVRLIGAPAAIWLSQALFYQRTFGKKADGWFAVGQHQFESETGLSAESQKSARVRLEKLGLLEESHGVGYKLRYRIRLDALVAALESNPGSTLRAKNPVIPVSDDSSLGNEQNQESPDSGDSASQPPENTGSQLQEKPEPSKEEDLSSRPSFETSATTSTEVDYQPGSSGEMVEVAESFELELQTPGSDARDHQPEPVDAPRHDGETRTGSQDSPGATARLEAAAALEAYLGGVRCREKYTTDHAQYLECRDRWLEDRRPEFILECISAARNGKGVEKSPYGALIKWLEFPASAPDLVRELDLRLERGLTPRLERLPRRGTALGMVSRSGLNAGRLATPFSRVAVRHRRHSRACGRCCRPITTPTAQTRALPRLEPRRTAYRPS